jgi:exopolyphosphatase / guanosine-5'-triphosphate,3'-diphosphate pyrophosphatase
MFAMTDDGKYNGTAPVVRPLAANEPRRDDARAASGERIAVIDIGSNSIRSTVVELLDDENWTVIAEERDMTRLADRLATTGLISPESMARSIDAIVRFHVKAERLGAAHVLASATSAVREAENRDEFLQLVRERAGLAVEIIGETDEGRLTFASVQRTVDLSKGVCVVADIGGGSLELVVSHDGVVTHNASLPLGAVRLTDAFGGSVESAGERRKDMSRHVERLLRQSLPDFAKPPRILVGCGGAFTTLATMAAAEQGLRVQVPGRKGFLHLAAVKHTQVRAMIKALKGTTVQARLHIPGLQPDRADIIVAGLTVIDRLMKVLGVRELRPNGGGVREGLILRTIARSGRGATAAPDVRTPSKREASASAMEAANSALSAVRALADRCKYSRQHSEQVATIALSLYDQLRATKPAVVPDLGADRRERLLLEAACVLHDIGQLVEYRRHHRHGEAIIRNAELAAFSAREIDVIALIVRHHRKAEPGEERGKKRDAFNVLDKKDQSLVRRLCAILRLADGLDRSHSQSVRGLTLDVNKRVLRVQLNGTGEVEKETGTEKGNLASDLASGAKKAGLLAKVCGRKVSLHLPKPPKNLNKKQHPKQQGQGLARKKRTSKQSKR